MVAFPPGGSTDIGARVVAAIAEKALGQTITVVNKGGAGGQVGWTDMVRQKPDGYYIGFINLPGHEHRHPGPRAQGDIHGKGLHADHQPGSRSRRDLGRADSPYKTAKDLVEAAKKSPNTIRAATTGILSDDHLAILMMEEAAPGAIYRIVHLDGGATQFKEIMGGNIDVAFDNVGSIVPRVRSGEVRALMVMDEARSKFLPDVPTSKEAGFPTVISSSTRGIAGPKDMPAPIVNKLRDVLQKAMADPEHIKKLEDQGLAIKVMVGAEYEKYFADTHAKARKYTEWAKNRPQK